MAAAAQAAACSSTTIDSVFRRAFTVFADRVAVTCEGRSWTYAELRQRSWRLANALACLGLQRGARIAVLCETRPEYIEAYAACAALGVTVVALNIRLHPEELLHCLEKTLPSAVISSGALIAAIAPLRGRAPFLKHWIKLDGLEHEGWLGYEAMLVAAAPDEPPVVAEARTSTTSSSPAAPLADRKAP
jgi:fatty-acyl-CoA synthase